MEWLRGNAHSIPFPHKHSYPKVVETLNSFMGFYPYLEKRQIKGEGYSSRILIFLSFPFLIIAAIEPFLHCSVKSSCDTVSDINFISQTHVALF